MYIYVYEDLHVENKSKGRDKNHRLIVDEKEICRVY